MEIKVAIAVVTNRQVRAKTLHAIMSLMAHTEHEIVPIVATEGYTIAEGRNYCVLQAIKNQCSHILFVDDDMTFPADTLERLLAHGKEVIGVYSFSRFLPLTPTVAFMNEDGTHKPHDSIARFVRPTELFKVFQVGMGVTLIDLKVFEVIDKPWFSWTVAESGQVLMGEDAWFCTQAKKAGYFIYCDPTIPVGHLGEYNFIENGTI